MHYFPGREWDMVRNIRQNTLKMLQDRGYVFEFPPPERTVEDIKDLCPNEVFHEQLLCQHPDGRRILVVIYLDDIFPTTKTQSGTEIVREVYRRAEAAKCVHAILVFSKKVTQNYTETLAQIQKENMEFQIFPHSDMAYSLMRGRPMPQSVEIIRRAKVQEIVDFFEKKHGIPDTDEEQAIRKVFICNPKSYPRVKMDDPLARYYGLHPGDVFRLVFNQTHVGRVPDYMIAE